MKVPMKSVVGPLKIVIVASLLSSQIVYANGRFAGFDPFAKPNPAESGGQAKVKGMDAQGEFQRSKAMATLADLFVANSSFTKVMGLDQATLNSLGENMAKNSEIWQFVARLKSNPEIMSTKSALINDLIRTRLQILSSVGNLDLNETTHSADSAAQSVIVKLALKAELAGSNADTASNLQFFLSQIEEGSMIQDMGYAALLESAIKIYNINRGEELESYALSEQVNQLSGRVIELFKAKTDRQSIELRTFGSENSSVTVRMSRIEAQQINELSIKRANDIVDAVLDPQKYEQTMTSIAADAIAKPNADVMIFLKNNKLLSNMDTASGKIGVPDLMQVKGEDIKGNVKEFTRLLNEYGVLQSRGRINSWRRNSSKTLSKISMGLINFKDVETLWQNINNLDETLKGQAGKLSETNGLLKSLKLEAYNKQERLQYAIAELHLLAGYLRHAEETFRASGDPAQVEVANKIKIHALPEILKEYEGAMANYTFMGIAIESMETLMSANNFIIRETNRLRDLAIPLIAINSSLEVATAQADAALKINELTRNFMNQQARRMATRVAEIRERLVKSAETDLISPDTLEFMQTTLAESQIALEKGLANAADKLTARSDRMRAIMSRQQARDAQGAINQGVGEILGSQGIRQQ